MKEQKTFRVTEERVKECHSEIYRKIITEYNDFSVSCPCQERRLFDTLKRKIFKLLV